MMISWQTPAQPRLRSFLRCLAILCLLAIPAHAPGASAQSPASASQPPAAPAAAPLHGVISLDGPWKFQSGDDPRWADPGLDDSSWLSVTLAERLDYQGAEPYSGYAWYRLHLRPEQLAPFGRSPASEPLEVLIYGGSVGQLSAYVNGVEVGRSKGMTEPPRMYQSQPFVVQLPPPDATGTRVLAIRTWVGPGMTVSRGLLTEVELGTQSEIGDRLATAMGRQWDEHAIAAMIVALLFLCVALLGAALYLSQRHHSEYLWLALMCLTVAVGETADALFGLALMPLFVDRVFILWTGHVFVAVTIEFVLRFTATKPNRLVRAFQVAVILLPFLSVLHLEQLFEILSVSAEMIFGGLICVLLFRSWRHGQREAGIMLVPFFFAAIGDSFETILTFAAGRHWISEQLAAQRYHLGPIGFSVGTVAYLVFLVSVAVVILYRFIRVSQDEQRTNAEISAARSVQALLIPTQLPSNRNFMLESAYLPVHGVGGDFFQVLPLKDDSLLIVVGDVSGKGLQAAMSSSTLVGALRNELSHDPATILNHLNHVLLGAVSTPGALPGLDSAPCFATCLCARIHPDGTLQIANAGHLSPYRDGRELGLPPSLPLGVIADNHYELVTFHLKRGDRLVFLSDGVVEATNPEGELFGFERTQQVSNEPARYIAQTAKHFGQTDDITVLSLYVASRTAQQDSEEAVLSH